MAWKLFACAASIVLACATPGVASATCKVSSVELPVTMVGTRAVAQLGINGQDIRMTVDSGAFYSVLTDAAAAQLQLPVKSAPYGLQVMGITGPVAARMTTVKQLQMVGGEMPEVDFLVGGNEPGSGTLGLLGRNLLSITDIEYDLAHGAIRFMFPEGDCSDKSMAYWANGTPVSELLLRSGGSQILPAIKAMGQLNGKNVRIGFDTGATSMVSLATAHRAGVTDADMKPAGVVRGAGIGQTSSWIAPFRTFQLATETSENNRLRIADFSIDDVDMLLGVDFFLSHRIYISKSRHRMYFTYNGGPVFALNGPAATEAGAAGEAEPADAAGYARRGAARAARRDFAHALEDLMRACEMAPQVAEHFTRRGLIHEALKQMPEALQDFDTALVLDPAQSEARWERLKQRTRISQRADALEDLRALDATLPAQAHLRVDMAQLYDRFGMKPEALAQLNQWVPVHLNETGLERVLNERCWIRTMLGVELNGALKDCDAAIEAQPDNPNFLDSRGWARLRRGEYREAVGDYERSLKLKPDGAWPLYGRGLAHLALGDAEQGRVDLEAARRLRPQLDDETARYGFSAEPQAAAKAP